LPFISDEKLETQKGMTNNRMVCQRSALPLPGPLTLRSKANPMTAEISRKLSQIARGRIKVARDDGQVPDQVAPKDGFAFGQHNQVSKKSRNHWYIQLRND
jgi:hypothetical protein